MIVHVKLFCHDGMAHMKAKNTLRFIENCSQHASMGVARGSFKVFCRRVLEANLALFFVEQKISMQAFGIVGAATVAVRMVPVPPGKAGRNEFGGGGFANAHSVSSMRAHCSSRNV